MKQILLLLLLVLFGTTALNAKLQHLLPRPKQVKTLNEKPFRLGRDICIIDPTRTPLLQLFFADRQCKTVRTGQVRVEVSLTDHIPNTTDYHLAGYENESYRLVVRENKISISAVSHVGVIRAVQTLQILSEGYQGTPCIEAVEITDFPSFKLRGYMHDVGRSFITIDELKKQIRLLAHFKVNTFHWHLTENQAWRFEVKRFPQLTADSAMTRFPGMFYTQQQCTELERYANLHGVKIIPEIDMPGHSKAFVRAMGYDMQTDKGVETLKSILQEVAQTFPHAPYIHIGGDEQTITYPHFLETMTQWVRSLGKRVVVWIPNHAGFGKADMAQLWSTAGKYIPGIPNIDCRYNYINHFDVFADVVGIYKSNIYYRQQGSEEIAGEICAVWNDHKLRGEEEIMRSNNFYTNVVASASRAWQGGGNQYIEQGGTTLPNDGPEYEDFKDWEERFLFHTEHCLQNEPIPYVRQTNIRWSVTDSLDRNGVPVAPQQLTGGGIYLNHTWRKTVPAIYDDKQMGDTAYAWTYIYSPKQQAAGALVELQNYSRSEQDHAPENKQWDRRGSAVYWNNQPLYPYPWTHQGRKIDNETAMGNENLTDRPPLKLHLQKGWNKVVLVLPNVKAKGVRLNKWMFTFVLTDLAGKKALPDIVYDPTKGNQPTDKLLRWAP